MENETMSNNHQHFTLIELLVAMAIIIILAGILIGGVGYAGRRADEAKTYAAIETMAMALEQFKADNGYYPPSGNGAQEIKFYRSADGLMLVLGDNEYKFFNLDTKKAYIELSYITGTTKKSAEGYVDAWGNSLHYKCPGDNNQSLYDLWSYGRDGKSSGSGDEKLDDLGNWEKA